jgi:hypothetical protein
MTKYAIHHSCGHTVEHQLYGPGKDRDRKEQRLAKQPCESCDRERRAEAACIANAGLPALLGSAKQIAWAEEIRANLLAQIDAQVAAQCQCWLAMPESEAVRALSEDKRGQAMALLADLRAKTLARVQQVRAEASCRWWIDNRAASITDLITAPIFATNPHLLALAREIAAPGSALLAMLATAAVASTLPGH